MMPIMSVVQQGGCYPSCRLTVGKQISCPTAFVDSFFLSPTLLICVCLWGLSPVVLSSGLSAPLVWLFCPLLSVHLTPSFSSCLLPVEPRPQVEWCRYKKSPSTLAQHAKPSICLSGSPPHLLLLLLLSRPPPPPLLLPPPSRILENRKCILLSDGWAPCSCWEEREKKSLSFPPGQSDEFSSLKAEGQLCFWERLGTLGAWAPGSHGHFSIMCAERING